MAGGFSANTNDERDKLRFREREENSTANRAKLVGLQYLDSREYKLKKKIDDVLTIPDMYKYRVAVLEHEGVDITLAVTVNTPQNFLKGLSDRFPDNRMKIWLISDSGFSEFMNIYDPPKVVTYPNISIKNYGNSTNLVEVSQILDSVRTDDLLWYLVEQAYALKTSDIHLECAADYVRVRFRINGVLHAIAYLTHQKYYQLSQSLAVRANISASGAMPQTSHLDQKVKDLSSGEAIILNMRIETVPTHYGQDVVMRLFNFKKEFLNLDNLGLSPREMKPLDEVIAHPHGLVLVVGPTGSGKTTTLYSLMLRLQNESTKIMTLEDPVEYGLEGMSQIPVDTRSGDSFAGKLRSVMRLDPDVIMVGEIRDEDTAKTSLQASITGHLVLSTFHASSAATALSRMMDMIGVNPIFSSAIKLILSQRLVRRLDDKTKIAYSPTDEMANFIREKLSVVPGIDMHLLENITLYKEGTSEENPFGFVGRTTIVEELTISEEIEKMLNNSKQIPSSTELEEAAIRAGMVPLLQAGLIKCLAGVTTIEEVMRTI